MRHPRHFRIVAVPLLLAVSLTSCLPSGMPFIRTESPNLLQVDVAAPPDLTYEELKKALEEEEIALEVTRNRERQIETSWKGIAQPIPKGPMDLSEWLVMAVMFFIGGFLPSPAKARMQVIPAGDGASRIVGLVYTRGIKKTGKEPEGKEPDAKEESDSQRTSGLKEKSGAQVEPASDTATVRSEEEKTAEGKKGPREIIEMEAEPELYLHQYFVRLAEKAAARAERIQRRRLAIERGEMIETRFGVSHREWPADRVVLEE
ncbi:MAG: hypothetical protein D6679_01270 [Candidatus Hydrogenedentota bacterium]|nr:MAG: hypothetical protein D6679_01270 [Candidatus Hydrogenedentota bacterium]